ncbi:hypothetical protein BV898_13251 [Hypsibius exemplaris]|uniref:BHLH domain-containing protein n=1 Tax=Hypsibius exemplaris TaxID=2072580 RepID=A0A1W0WB74_HYPEX|nr:hypothetical protein BV898_13251 [Hypsibius exemplaris]
MGPHRFHRKPNRRTNTKTMNQMIVDIMELENDSTFDKCNQNPGNSRVMSDRNANYRILDPTTGHLLPAGQHSRAAREPSSRSHRSKGYDNRKKKDDHNVIERKRRNNINNLIKELRALLPSGQAVNETSKGSTLKATVDYMKELKRDRDRLRAIETTHKACHNNIISRPDEELLLRVQELESLVEAQRLATRMNSADQSQMSPINATTQDEGVVSPAASDLSSSCEFAEDVKQELLEQQQRYLAAQEYFSYTTYLDAAEQDGMTGGVVLSEEELANIFNEMSPMEQIVSLDAPDPLVSYYDMAMSEGSVTELL